MCAHTHICLRVASAGRVYVCAHTWPRSVAHRCAGGTAAVLSGIQKYSDAKNAAQEVKELATSFENEAAAQVVEVEGRSLKLTGTAEEQYREWRRLLAEIYREERAPEQPAPATAPATAKP